MKEFFRFDTVLYASREFFLLSVLFLCTTTIKKDGKNESGEKKTQINKQVGQKNLCDKKICLIYSVFRAQLAFVFFGAVARVFFVIFFMKLLMPNLARK
jgi:hypothetical protein